MEKMKSSLQAKVILQFFGVFLAITAIHFLVQYFVIVPSFVKVERQQGLINLERITNAIDSELASLKMISWDYASWTDTYNFVQDQNQSYVDNNLTDETIENFGIQLLVILNEKNEFVWGKTFDSTYENEIVLKDFDYEIFPQDHPILQFEGSTDPQKIGRTGIMSTEYGPLLFASSPILRTDSSGPSRGTLVMAKFLSADFVENLNSQLELPIKLILPADEKFSPMVANIDKNGGTYIETFTNNLSLYDAYLDVNSKPAFIIETEYPREISQSGYATVRFSLAMIVLSSLAFLSLQFFLLRKSVLTPIATLTNFTKAIGKNKEFNQRIPIQRPDEIGALVEGMNYMIGTIEKQTNLLVEMNTKLEVTSRTDGLTSIPNRRMFDEVFGKFWNMHIREKQYLGLIIADIDFFKLFNDTYGHQKGDECLTLIALTIQKEITRSGDLIARYGGEEFVVLLPNTDLEGTQLVAEKLRKAVEKLEIPHISSAVNDFVTISLGMGAIIPASTMSPEEFFDNVDKALYQSKENGRNQVAIYQG
jgi:diguanylate cyclase (GGDEF)-like protein